jgi:hypothetical protein
MHHVSSRIRRLTMKDGIESLGSALKKNLSKRNLWRRRTMTKDHFLKLIDQYVDSYLRMSKYGDEYGDWYTTECLWEEIHEALDELIEKANRES